MISISMTTASTSGNVVFKADVNSEMDSKSARVTRTATLDGRVYINHSGYTDGDRTLRIRGKVTAAQEAILNNIFKNYTTSFISFKDGLFLGTIPTLSIKNGQLIMKYFIEQKETS